MRYVLSLILVLTFSVFSAEPPSADEASKIVKLFVQNGKSEMWSATGFYVSETWLMTAAHTFKKGENPFIIVAGARVYVAIIKLDYKEDICILETPQSNPGFFVLQRNGTLRALGFPGNAVELTVTSGVSNAREISSSNPIYKGMSGGPIINENGEVVGMGVRSDLFKKNRCYSITSDRLSQFLEAARKSAKHD